MIRLLKSFVLWLEKRFPERVIVTQADYASLRVSVVKLEALLANSVKDDRIKKIEDEIAKFNVALGFGVGRPGAMPFQR